MLKTRSARPAKSAYTIAFIIALHPEKDAETSSA
jgi:hypothetical protein